MKRLLLSLLVALIPATGWPQATVLQGGSWTQGYVPVYSSAGGSQPIVQNSGTAGGGGVGVREMAVIARGTGTAPFSGQGTGPLGTVFSIYDGPISSSAGYHYLSFSANAQGGGLIAYGAAGGASNLPLYLSVNGTAYEFPFTVGGIVGPSSSVSGDLVCWNNTSGTLVKDCGASFLMQGASSGSMTVAAPAAASGTLTLPSGTDTVVARTSTDTLTNKTYDTGGTGNVFRINGTQVSAVTGTGNTAVLSASPALTGTPSIAAATGTSLSVTGALTAYSGTVIPAGGTTGSGVKVSSTANFGVFFGSGAPSLSAAQGSLYLRSNGAPYYNTDGATTWAALGAQSDTVPIGVCFSYGGSSAPTSSYLLAYGQAISRSTYATLFGIYGTTYGSGDGSTTFNMPDARGRVIPGLDNMGGSAASRMTSTTMTPDGETLGATGGTQTHTLVTGEIPAHAHGTVGAANIVSNTNTGAGLFTATAGVDVPLYNAGTTTANAGGGGAHLNMQPSIAMNTICKVQ